MNKLNRIIKSYYIPFSRIIHEAWALFFPWSYAKYHYYKATGKKIDLKNPRDFDQKNYWLRLNSDLTLWTELADKHKVREYVEQCGHGEILTKLYGVWEKAEDIDFNKLPDKFVLKTNHSFGKVYLVPDKSKLDTEKVRKQLNKWLGKKNGLLTFEPHYWNIPRKIIAEEYLQDNNTSNLSSSLIDYKFFCINGKPEVIKVMFNRTLKSNKDKNKPGYQTLALDLDWNLMNHIVPESKKKVHSLVIPRPECLEEMIIISRALAKPFPQVRVDLYEVNGKVYFGELTFTPGGGRKFTPEYLNYLGEKMDLSLAKPRTKRFIV